MAKEAKKIELWEGYEVELDTGLWNNWGFVSDLSKAEKQRDLPEMVGMYFLSLGGDKIYKDFEKHCIDDHGEVTLDDVMGVVELVNSNLPKAGKGATKPYRAISK